MTQHTYNSQTIIEKLTSTLSENNIIENLVVDLENLLNTKLQKDESLMSYQEAQESILSYGMPSFSEFSKNHQATSEILSDMIKQIISIHEPRLYDVTVEVAKLDKYVLDFKISATIRTQSDEPIEIQFDSSYHPNLQHFNVSEGSE